MWGHARAGAGPHATTSCCSLIPPPRPSTPRRYFQHSGLSLPFDVYVINLDTQASRLAAFQQSFQASGALRWCAGFVLGGVWGVWVGRALLHAWCMGVDGWVC